MEDKKFVLALAMSVVRNRDLALTLKMVTNYNVNPKLLIYDMLIRGDPDLFEYGLDHH